MSNPQGLIACGANWGTPFCITKTLEVVISLGLIVWIIIQMVNYYHYVRVIKSSFILIVEILMLLTLTFNIAFGVYHTTYPLLYIQIYFYNMYFVILCYYLIFNVFKRIKYMRALVACFVGFLSLLYLLILIDSFIQNVQMCKELSYLVMNSIGLFICMVMFSAYRYNELKQRQRIEKLNKMFASQQIVIKDQQNQQLIKMKTPSKVDFNQPFRFMWLMIIANILCQIIDLTESLAFKLQWNPQQNQTCPISQNQSINGTANFLFVLFTLYMGFAATIYVFRQKRKAKDDFQARIKSPSDFSSVASHKGNLQMVGKEGFSHFNSNSSNMADNLSDLYDRFNYDRRNNFQKQSY